VGEPKYLKKLPGSASYRGNAEAGEIEIIDKKESSKVRVKTGILVKDELHYIVRDAVKFPSGDVEAQLRVVSRYMVDGPAGVVALASRDGQIFLREMFRHGTRRWELEATRGGREPGLTSEEAARKEIDEELGFRVKTLEKIGEVSAETAFVASTLPIFWAELEPGPPRDHPESTEAFGRIIGLSPADLKKRIANGDIRDGYTLAAVLHAQVVGKIVLP
jgi:8-oxo-dGTP pyrophosphatase MutT (NUDIX family)